jgi:hypothetical protein
MGGEVSEYLHEYPDGMFGSSLTDSLAKLQRKHDTPPHSVRIGAVRYSIEMVDRAMLGDHGRLGDCNPNTATIRVADSRPPAVIAETLIHEVLHAVMDDAGMDMDKDDEERLVSGLSPRLAALIADNPALMGSLADMLSEEP